MAHDPRPLSQRFDLTYVHKRQWPFNWIKPLSIVIPIAVGLYLASVAMDHDHRAHSPGPVTHAHEMFENDCGACHQADPEHHGFWLPVQDSACLACHIAAAHPDPHDKLFAGDAMPVSDYLGKVAMSSDCVACHIEHKGREHDLGEIEDRLCVQCHGDLGQYAGTDWPADHAIDNTITAFAGDHPDFDVLAGEPIDDTRLVFEHATHMNPATGGMQDRIRDWIAHLDAQGIVRDHIALALPGAPGGSFSGDITDGITLQLTCAACHQTDADGMYMQPISFEQHCKGCHDLGKQNGMPVPHGSRAVDFIARIAMQTAIDPPQPSAPPSSGKPGGPGGPRGRRPGPPAGSANNDSDEARTVKLDELQQQIEDQLKDLGKEIVTTTSKCAQCHGPVKSAAEIVDPEIPGRWMTRGRFGHQAHRFVSCVSCHPQADYRARLTESYPNEDDPDSVAAQLSWTRHTRDVMLPSINTCLECHSAARRTAGGAARHDCVMCHVYHGSDGDPHTRHAMPAEPTSIGAFLREMEE
jgi:predicted CXXCH cytochrome family protein